MLDATSHLGRGGGVSGEVPREGRGAGKGVRRRGKGKRGREERERTEVQTRESLREAC